VPKNAPERSEFAELLDLLGIGPCERVAICSQKPGGRFDGNTVPARGDAEALALSTPYRDHRDIWFGVNPVALPTGYHGRGRTEHVTRCTALFADVDLKAGGVADSATADTITKGISAVLRQPPAAVVFSGHGGHPYWLLDPADDAWTLDTEGKRADALAVYRRFHRLCTYVAESHCGRVDNVAELTRVLRVPGTFNRKNPAEPIAVEMHTWPYGAGGPLTFAEVVEALDEFGVPEQTEDRETPGEVVSEPDGWAFGSQTDPYVAAMVGGWATDRPASRHGWLVSQATRLACAHRLGLITSEDHAAAVMALSGAFVWLLVNHGQARKLTPGEVAGALAWGVRRAAAMTGDRAANDLGLRLADAFAVYDVRPGYDRTEGDQADGDGNSGGDQPEMHRRLRVTWASEIEAAPVRWLWVDISTHNSATLDPYWVGDIACVAVGHTWTPPEVETEGRIACGMVSVAAGREGSGKSSFGIWIGAKITRGELPGSHYGTPRRVYYLATEDSWKHTLVPRLIAAGADLTMIARVEVVVNENDTLTLCLPDDVGLLTDSINENDVALVVVDPLMSTINDSLSTNNTREVRTALEPLAAMADQTGASVVCIAHFNKATGLDAASRISGSGAFKDLARAVMVFAVGPDGERVFSQPKNSVGRNDLPSLSYEVAGAVVDTPTGKTSTGVLRFTGQADQSVEDVLAGERGRNRRRSDVTTFLLDYIAEHADGQTGEVPAADVIAAGTGKGFTENQIKLARRRCDDPKIATRREGFGEDGKTLWKIACAR
jgi:hypothetical protein